MRAHECRTVQSPLTPELLSRELHDALDRWARGLPTESVTACKVDGDPCWAREPWLPATGATAVYRGVDLRGQMVGARLELSWWYDYPNDRLVIRRSEN